MDNIPQSKLRLSEYIQLQQLKALAAEFAISIQTCKYLGLSYGKMGVVIFLFHYARQIQDALLEDKAVELLSEIQNSLHVDLPLGYAIGLSGIGAGIEYLAQQDFIRVDIDDFQEDFDKQFIKQIHNRKLYLSTQDLTGMKRYFSARLENPETKKRDFLHATMDELLSLLDLHYKLSVTFEELPKWHLNPDDPENWGIEGRAGKGLTILTTLNPQHNTWLKLR